MERIKNKIIDVAPNAIFLEGEKLRVELEPKDLRAVAEVLRYDEEEPLDYLAMITGMDFGEKLGVIYLLASSKDLKKEVELRTATSDRQNPLLYTVSDLWGTAHLNEREIYALLGIRFINNPDMRRFLLRSDWVGFPLRKDYDASPALNPINLKSYEIKDIAPYIKELPDGTLEEGVKDIFWDDAYIINIGPQHPSTHGVMHFRVALDGEIIEKIDVHSGYIHRGIEKMCEKMTYPQMLHLTDRLDYLSASMNRHALCMCIEKAAGIEVPERAVYIRTIFDELERIDSHLVAWGTMSMDLGATTAFIYGFREREIILDIFEKTCGGRLIINYNVVGGVMYDIYPEFQQDIKAFIKELRRRIPEYHKLVSGNIIARDRMKGHGILEKETAITYGVGGVNGRASGWSCDIRKHVPYALYDQVEFKEVIRDDKDSYARYLNRIDEMEESMKIIEQLVDKIPDGPYCAKVKPVLKLPEGEYVQRVETARGEFGVFIKSDGDKTPYRVKFRSPSYSAVSVMPIICDKEKISDFIAIGGSMDYVIPDIDR